MNIDIETHGNPGSVIEGSRMLRAYCSVCGGAMRVTRETWTHARYNTAPTCLDCMSENESNNMIFRLAREVKDMCCDDLLES